MSECDLHVLCSDISGDSGSVLFGVSDFDQLSIFKISQ